MSDQQWKEWGKADPYFGVYSEKRFRKNEIANHRDEFFQTGATGVDVLMTRAERAFGSIKTGSALEFGSGVGRMSIPLARRFDRVVGVEISPDMIREAERNCAEMGVDNVTFVPSDDALSHVQNQFDLVLSYIVLQHIEPGRGMAILGRLLDKVAPEGLATIQASVRRPDRKLLGRAKYAVRHNLPFVAALWNLVRGRGWSTLTMRMSEYDVVDILRLYKARGMGDVLVSEHFQEIGRAHV